MDRVRGAPGDPGGEHPAEQQADAAAGAGDGAVPGDRAGPFLTLSEADRQQRQGRGSGDCGADTLEGAGAEQPAVSAAGREAPPRLAGFAILRHPQAWSFILGKFLTDPVWWFFLIWLPDYFKKTRGLDIKKSWVHLVTTYAIVTALSLGGGWLAGALARRSGTPAPF